MTEGGAFARSSLFWFIEPDTPEQLGVDGALRKRVVELVPDLPAANSSARLARS
jgi:hypothetical protein